MERSRCIALGLGAAVVAAVALSDAPAHACGWWRLTDYAKKKDVSFDVSYIRTKAKGTPDGAYMKPIAVVNGAQGSLTCATKKQELVISGDRIFAGKRQIATVDGEQWEVDGHKYQVTIVDRGENVRIWRWHVIVNEGEVLVASGEAMSFACVYSGGSSSTGDDRLDVARQLMCYLLARDQPGMKLEDMPRNRAARRHKTER